MSVPAVERSQRGGKHQHLGLHEGKIWESRDDLLRLLAQILFFSWLSIHDRHTKKNKTIISTAACVYASVCLIISDLVDVLVFSMVDMRRAKASATRLPEEVLVSSLEVVSS